LNPVTPEYVVGVLNISGAMSFQTQDPTVLSQSLILLSQTMSVSGQFHCSHLGCRQTQYVYDSSSKNKLTKPSPLLNWSGMIIIFKRSHNYTLISPPTGLSVRSNVIPSYHACISQLSGVFISVPPMFAFLFICNHRNACYMPCPSQPYLDHPNNRHVQ